MITITITYDNAESITGFTIDGHAEWAEPGSDIVCAAVSAISQTALLGLERYARKQTSYRHESGHLTVQIKAPTAETDVILRIMVLGLHEIARQYSSYVAFDS